MQISSRERLSSSCKILKQIYFNACMFRDVFQTNKLYRNDSCNWIPPQLQTISFVNRKWGELKLKINLSLKISLDKNRYFDFVCGLIVGYSMVLSKIRESVNIFGIRRLNSKVSWNKKHELTRFFISNAFVAQAEVFWNLA